MQRALDGVQPVAQALGDGVVLAFLGERQGGVAVVFRLGLDFGLAVALAGGLVSWSRLRTSSRSAVSRLRARSWSIRPSS